MHQPALTTASPVPALYLPRRHRRRLLFPPGMVALAGLLWLGSMAVGWWEKQLKPLHAIELIVLAKPVADLVFPSETGQPGDIGKLHYSELAQLRKWDTLLLGMEQATDEPAMQHAEKLLAILGPDSYATTRGLRVRLSSSAPYKSLIRLVDLANQLKVQSWMLDTYHTPVTFYAYNGKLELHPAPTHRWDEPQTHSFCGTSALMRHYLDELKAKATPPQYPLKSSQQLLATPEWRIPLAFLAMIMLISCWQLSTRKRV